MLIIIQNAYLTSNRNEEFYNGELIIPHSVCFSVCHTGSSFMLV